MNQFARHRQVSPLKVLTTFLILGATSIGGGMMAHIREAVVVREGWLSDEEFLECYGLCQTLPGLNTTNLSVLIGDRVAGTWGALLAMLAVMAPGGGIVLGLATYFLHGPAPAWTFAGLKGVAAVSVALLFSAALKVGRKLFGNQVDLQIVLLTFICAGVLHLSLPLTLAIMLPLSLWMKRPQVAVC
ncbi:MAG: chromate transporter [Vulcanimicrobiota bacterium]